MQRKNFKEETLRLLKRKKVHNVTVYNIPASDYNIKVLKPVEIAFVTTIHCTGFTEVIHHNVCIVP
jgi:hypothetical protein